MDTAHGGTAQSSGVAHSISVGAANDHHLPANLAAAAPCSRALAQLLGQRPAQLLVRLGTWLRLYCCITSSLCQACVQAEGLTACLSKRKQPLKLLENVLAVAFKLAWLGPIVMQSTPAPALYHA